MIYKKCNNCGKRIKNLYYFNNLPYGLDCWNEVATDYIEKRDLILNAPVYDRVKLYNLVKAYGVEK